MVYVGISPAAKAAFIAAPAAKLMPTLGIVTAASKPPIGAGVPSSVLFAINTNLAPRS